MERGLEDAIVFRRRFGRPTGLQPRDRIDLVLYWQEKSSRGEASSRGELSSTVDIQLPHDQTTAVKIARVQLNDISLTDANLPHDKLMEATSAPSVSNTEERSADRMLRLDVTARLLPRNELVVHAQWRSESADLPFRVQLEIFVGGREELVAEVVE